MGKEHNTDLLSQIYRGMNETGKEKLKQVAVKFMGIWSTVNGEAIKPACTDLDKKG